MRVGLWMETQRAWKAASAWDRTTAAPNLEGLPGCVLLGRLPARARQLPATDALQAAQWPALWAAGREGHAQRRHSARAQGAPGHAGHAAGSRCQLQRPKYHPKPILLLCYAARPTHHHTPSPPQVLLRFKGQDVGVLDVESRWVPNKVAESQACYASTSLEHPAVHMVATERGRWYLGGKVTGLDLPERCVAGRGAEVQAGRQVVVTCVPLCHCWCTTSPTMRAAETPQRTARFACFAAATSAAVRDTCC